MELKNNEFMSDWLREHTPKEPAKGVLHEYDNGFTPLHILNADL